MKLPITPNRDFLKRSKKAHVYRALLKRRQLDRSSRKEVAK